MTIGIIPSSMQGKGGKRLNRNNSPIKSIFYRINYFPARKPRTKAASPSNSCNSQTSPRNSRSAEGMAHSAIKKAKGKSTSSLIRSNRCTSPVPLRQAVRLSSWPEPHLSRRSKSATSFDKLRTLSPGFGSRSSEGRKPLIKEVTHAYD
jgi:hypothetical protein